MPVYQKTVYSTSDGTASMLNIKRLSISVTALSSDENWCVMLEFDDVEDYRITAEAKKQVINTSKIDSLQLAYAFA